MKIACNVFLKIFSISYYFDAILRIFLYFSVAHIDLLKAVQSSDKTVKKSPSKSVRIQIPPDARDQEMETR